jgi:peptidyl-prolyl cis-trans isomerase C
MRRSRPISLALALVVGSLGSIGAFAGCNEKPVSRKSDAAAIPGGLTQEQADKPLAKFGTHVITLGDFAQLLADMPEYERVRYQSLERRKELLNTQIMLYLLADEAKRLGLDNDPQVQEETRQILVAWMRGKLLSDLPPPSAIPEAEVRAWYDAHIDEYREPERRRIAQIVTKDEATAKKAADEAKTAGPTGWGDLVKKYSEDKPTGTEAPELSGDLGYLTAPSDPHPPTSPKITAAIRTAAFAMKDVGEVSAPVKDDNGWHVLKMLVRNEAHEQSYADVERSIRVRILQEKRAAKEKAVLDETRAAVKVEIDEGALAAIALTMATEPTTTNVAPSIAPSGSQSSAPSGSTSASVAPSASASTSASTKPTKPCVVDAQCGKGMKCCPGAGGANVCAKVCGK